MGGHSKRLRREERKRQQASEVVLDGLETSNGQSPRSQHSPLSSSHTPAPAASERAKIGVATPETAEKGSKTRRETIEELAELKPAAGTTEAEECCWLHLLPLTDGDHVHF
jgi:hypothetical protein